MKKRARKREIHWMCVCACMYAPAPHKVTRRTRSYQQQVFKHSDTCVMYLHNTCIHLHTRFIPLCCLIYFIIIIIIIAYINIYLDALAKSHQHTISSLFFYSPSHCFCPVGFSDAISVSSWRSICVLCLLATSHQPFGSKSTVFSYRSAMPALINYRRGINLSVSTYFKIVCLSASTCTYNYVTLFY